jgi:hypothetical protein
MVAKAKAKTAGAKKTKTAAKRASEFPLGISDLAKALNLKEATARVKLRDAKVKRAGKSYGWKTSAEMKKVADKLVTA